MGSLAAHVDDALAGSKRLSAATFVRKHLRWIALVFFYAVVANIPYWIAAHQFEFVVRGWFCLEYVAVGLLALLIPRFAAAGLLVAVIAVDLLCAVRITYMLPVRECFENLRALEALSGTPRNYALAVILAVVVVAGAAAMLRGNKLPNRQRWYAAACLAAFIALILGADFLSISIISGRRPALVRSQPILDGITLRMSEVPRLARVPVVRLVHLGDLDGEDAIGAGASASPATRIPSATEAGIEAAGIVPGENPADYPNLVLVLLESWGLAEDAPLRDALTVPYTQPDLLAKYRVIQGQVPFYGPTIAGEARELCGSRMGFRILIAPKRDLENCVPDQLEALGYQTLSVHGLTGRMFNRAFWYANIGFQQQWFHNELARQGLPDCPGAFNGTCDASIAAWIGRRLQDGRQPTFIHWMTLNSHIPVVIPAQLSNGAPCLADLSLTPGTALCSWYQLVENVHRSVAQVAMGALPRPTVFVIVGDHVPPFGEPALHDRFSRTDVPYLLLVPRGSPVPAKNTLAHSAKEPYPGKPQPATSRP
jgi:hypothetical protein